MSPPCELRSGPERILAAQEGVTRRGLPARQPRTPDQSPVEEVPKTYAQLQREGKLEESVYAAQELNGETLYRLTMEEKLPYDQAWELAREGLAFLPSEEDQPSQDVNPSELQSQ